MVAVDYDSLMEDIAESFANTISTIPEVEVRGDSFRAADIPSSTSNKWIKLENVVCVVFDLQNSTQLGLNKYYTTTARIYKSSIEGAVRILREFGANFIDIQGDGGFGLFWGDRAFERALCAAVTVRTFSESWEDKLPSAWTQSDRFPVTGFKVGIHADPVLVKRLGTIRVREEQEPVWAGKPVNFASKCAQSAERHQVIVTAKVWDHFSRNDFIAFSCDCGGPTANLWEKVEVGKLPDDAKDGFLLTNGWCEDCGIGFIESILAGETRRSIPNSVRHALPLSQMKVALKDTQAIGREQLRARRRGLSR